MLGLVLEGGGARGAYQAGVIHALLSHGYNFNAVSGTSIGALNGVMLAQHRFNESYELWQNMEFSLLFDFESKYAENIATMKLDKDTVKYFFSKLKEAIANKGLDTSKIKALLNKYIDEDLLRNSDIDFGIMTVSLSEMKPYAMFVSDIPYGTVADYVMASANFPGFSAMRIDDKLFADGGLYDNLPINMMVDKGYRDLIAIETKSFIPKRKCRDSFAQVEHIVPSEKPGRMLEFNPEPVAKAMKIGHFDAMRHIKGYIGAKYYLKTDNVSPFGYGLLDMKKTVYSDIAKVYGIKAAVADKMYNIKRITEFVNKVNKKSFISDADALLFIVEKVAALLRVERLKVYSIREFIAIVCDAIIRSESSKTLIKAQADIKVVEIINKFL